MASPGLWLSQALLSTPLLLPSSPSAQDLDFLNSSLWNDTNFAFFSLRSSDKAHWRDCFLFFSSISASSCFSLGVSCLAVVIFSVSVFFVIFSVSVFFVIFALIS